MEAYPLQWPDYQQRTPHCKIQESRFDTTFDIARKLVFNEIARLGGKNPILSTNIPLRKDGYPYASAREPDDRGVAVYFDYKGKQMVFACDKWQTTKENVKAVSKTKRGEEMKLTREQETIDTADHVFHIPTGEVWVTAFVRNGKLACCGWPLSMEPIENFLVHKKASEDERMKLLEDMANMSEGDARTIYAQDKLKQKV